MAYHEGGVETFEAQLLRCNECGSEFPDQDFGSALCLNSSQAKPCLGVMEPVLEDREVKVMQGSTLTQTHKVPVDRWWWWSCQPGCLPDGEAYGPFDTEAEALADARKDEVLEEVDDEA